MKASVEEIEKLQRLGARFLGLWVEPALEPLEAAGSKAAGLSDSPWEASLVYYFLLTDRSIRSIYRQSQQRVVPSIYSYFGCADWAERDAAKRYGLRFTGNPNASRISGENSL